MVTEHSAIHNASDEYAISLGNAEPQVRTKAVEYYLANGLSDTPKANALLREYHAKDVKELDSFQKGALSLLRTRVFDFIIETGHMDKFKATISA